MRSPPPLEYREQWQLAEYLNGLGLLWHHTAMGGISPKASTKLRLGGASKGIPDVLIFERPPNRPSAPGVAIELKRAGTKRLAMGRPTQEQEQWLADLGARGWMVRVCHGAADAKRWLRGLGW